MRKEIKVSGATRKSSLLPLVLLGSMMLGSCTSVGNIDDSQTAEWFVSPISQIEGTLDELCERALCVDGSVVLPIRQVVHATSDIDMPDTLGALSLQRTWTNEGSGIFGSGWISIWDSTLTGSTITGLLPGRPLEMPQVDSRIPLSDGTEITFNSNGQVVEVCEAETVCTRAVREPDRIVLQPTRETSEEIRLELREGLVRDAVATDGRTVRYTYNNGKLIEAQSLSGVETYEYSNDGLLVSVTAAGGNRTFVYEDGRVSQMTDSLGGLWEFLHVEDEVVKVVRPEGSQRSYRFDGDLLIEATDSILGVLMRRDYEGRNLRREERPTDGIVIDMLEERKVRYRQLATQGPPMIAVYGFDQRGRLVTAESAAGLTTYTYNGWGTSPISVETPTGSFRYEYDDDGLVIAATDADGYQVALERGPNGLPVRVSDGITDMEFGYDPAGRIIAQTSGGHTDHARFDTLGRLVGSTTASGKETKYEYDTLGRLIRVQGPQVTELSYTAEGWLDDPSSALIGLTADEDLQAVTIAPWLENSDGTFSRQDAAGASMIADSWGRVIRIESGGRVVERDFDVSGRLVRLNGPDGNIEVGYTSAGRVGKVVVDGVEITVRWAGDLMTSLEMSTGAVYEFAYDRSGRVVSARQGSVRWDYTYDLDGRLIGVDTPIGPLSYLWDSTGMPVESVLPSGATRSYGWIDGNLKSVKDFDGSEIDFERNEAGHVQKIRSEEVVTTLETDAQGRINSYRIGNGPEVAISYGPNGVSGLSIGDSTELWSYSDTGVIDSVLRGGDRFELEWEAPGILRSVHRDGIRLAEAIYDTYGRAVEVKDHRGVTAATFDWSSLGLSTATVSEESLQIGRDRDGFLTEIVDGEDRLASFEYQQGVIQRVAIGDWNVGYEYRDGRLSEASVSGNAGDTTLSWGPDGSSLTGFDGTVGSGAFGYDDGGVVTSVELSDERFVVESDDQGRLKAGGRAKEILSELFTQEGRFAGSLAVGAGPVAPLLSLIPADLNLVLPTPTTPDEIVQVALADALPQLPRPLVPENELGWSNNIINTTLAIGATVSIPVSAGQQVEMVLRPGDIQQAMLVELVPSFRISEALFDRLGPGPCLLCRVVDFGSSTIRSIGSITAGIIGFVVTNPVTTALATFAFVGATFLAAFACQGNLACQAATVVGSTLVAQALSAGETGLLRGLYETVATPIKSIVGGVTSLDAVAVAAGAAVIAGSLLSRRIYNGTPVQSRLLQQACRINRVPCLSYSKYPGAAGNILAAQSAGAGRIARVNRVGVAERRQGALAGIPTRSGFDRDEAPPAFLRANSRRVHVSYVNPSDNRGAGAALRAQLSAVPNGRFVLPLIIP